MKTYLLEETATETIWNFVCVGCGVNGELKLLKKDGMTPFGCPEGCGATYVPWKYLGQWQLKCVVQPEFGDAHAK